MYYNGKFYFNGNELNPSYSYTHGCKEIAGAIIASSDETHGYYQQGKFLNRTIRLLAGKADYELFISSFQKIVKELGLPDFFSEVKVQNNYCYNSECYTLLQFSDKWTESGRVVADIGLFLIKNIYLGLKSVNKLLKHGYVKDNSKLKFIILHLPDFINYSADLTYTGHGVDKDKLCNGVVDWIRLGKLDAKLEELGYSQSWLEKLLA